MDTNPVNKSDPLTLDQPVHESTDFPNDQPVTRNAKSATRPSQPETRDPKPVARNPKHPTRNAQLATCDAINLGMMEYNQAWQLQSDLVAARLNGSVDRDIILFLEHPPVFTLGRRGGRDYLQVGESFLEQTGIPIVQAERGGYITYHGPGQLVVYPIVNLEARRIGVTEFVAALEKIMLLTVRSWGLKAQRNSINAGIWMGNRKMGSIGIALRKGISFHGMALNVNVDLTPFSWVQPCGLEGVSMTSIQHELGEEIPLNAVLNAVKENFNSVLELDLNDISHPELQQQLLNRKNDSSI